MLRRKNKVPSGGRAAGAEERSNIGKDMHMKRIRKEDRTSLLVEQLLDVWERSVRETHLFLSDGEIEEIKKYVPAALTAVPDLIVETNTEGTPIAFMVIDVRTTEYGVKELTVNEQNPQAKGFYEHMGFRVRERSEIDEQGNPYPILFMELKSGN